LCNHSLMSIVSPVVVTARLARVKHVQFKVWPKAPVPLVPLLVVV